MLSGVGDACVGVLRAVAAVGLAVAEVLPVVRRCRYCQRRERWHRFAGRVAGPLVSCRRGSLTAAENGKKLSQRGAAACGWGCRRSRGGDMRAVAAAQAASCKRPREVLMLPAAAAVAEGFGAIVVADGVAVPPR